MSRTITGWAAGIWQDGAYHGGVALHQITYDDATWHAMCTAITQACPDDQWDVWHDTGHPMCDLCLAMYGTQWFEPPACVQISDTLYRVIRAVPVDDPQRDRLVRLHDLIIDTINHFGVLEVSA
jgi:hypothetical protein